MLPTLMRNPPRLNPDLTTRHHRASGMIRAQSARKAA